MIFDVFSDCVERVFKLQKQCHILLNVWRTIDPLLSSDGIILKSRKCGRESEKILEKISLIWLISLNFSQPGKILKQFLCFVKLPGEIIGQVGGGEGRPQQGARPRALSLLLFCCDNWKHGVDIVFLGYYSHQSTRHLIPASTSPHQGRISE